MLEFEPSIHLSPKVGKRDDLWWKGAIIYQIYPRSFADSDGDGIGDLPGITARLDHVAGLGVDAIWISPFMRSPQADYGYDVSDYRDVDPMFGTLADFDRLVERAHALDLKVMIDFVPSHTSIEHRWFRESRASRDNPRADWYVWADPKEDGTPPNNWLSVFGGAAWEFDTGRGQYYLHNFLRQQPDLNFHNPEVIEALTEEARFWFERGIDGFRIDAIDFGVHDPGLRDNPPRPPQRDQHGATTPFNMQYQLWNKARPELCEKFFKPVFRMSEAYGAVCLLGEISGDTSLQRMADYSSGGGLDMAYSFQLLSCTLAEVRQHVEEAEACLGDGWACWAFSNHDCFRSATRFGGRNPDDRLRRMIPQLLCSLRGSICFYQGEELGLEETELTYEQLQDPVGKTFWPASKGRDGCRTPMPWQTQAEHGGFTSGTPWLPVGPVNQALAVDRQDGDPESVLNSTRAFLHWRKRQEALRTGDMAFVDAGEGLLVFSRRTAAQSLLCAFNITDSERQFELDAIEGDAGCPTATGERAGHRVTLPAYGVFFATITDAS